ncbi:MAG: hypothetical protein CVV44_04470 [Spirochaetae bacterium HGW-Spirochaetae-1]|jgi:diacylglycerol kinase family enzyme|nr:MAG: hypothetical protein CVV44_04470 [Spirochaetae bacterium HGW-Spirochaetae-1]
MDTVGIIINANAKKNRKMKKDLESLYREIGGQYVDVQLTSSLDQLSAVIRDFKKKGVSYLGVAGGDGSLHHAMTRAMEIYGEGNVPPLLILKGGTMDNVSRSIFLKGKGPEILKRLISRLKRKEAISLQTRSTMKINDSYCFLFGTGLVTNFLNEVYGGREKGLVRNLQVIFRAVKEIVSKPAGASIFDGIYGEFIVDGEKLDITYSSAILSGTVEHIGMGFSPLSRALENQNSYHAIISGIPPTTFLKNLYKIKKGKAICHPLNYDILLNRLLIKCPGPFQYTMDGDIYESPGELEVVLGPQVNLVSV